MYDLIVIGAGPGGYEAAAHAAKMGKQVALIEKGRMAAPAWTWAASPPRRFCAPPSSSMNVRRPQVRRAPRLRRVRHAGGGRAQEPRRRHAHQGRRGHVETRGCGNDCRPRAADLAQRRRSGRGALRSRQHPAGHRLAAGRAADSGIRSEGVLDSDSIFALTHVPEKIAIIGGGYIGLEFACFFNEVGAKVAVYEMLPQIAAGPISKSPPACCKS